MEPGPWPGTGWRPEHPWVSPYPGKKSAQSHLTIWRPLTISHNTLGAQGNGMISLFFFFFVNALVGWVETILKGTSWVWQGLSRSCTTLWPCAHSEMIWKPYFCCGPHCSFPAWSCWTSGHPGWVHKTEWPGHILGLGLFHCLCSHTLWWGQAFRIDLLLFGGVFVLLCFIF